MNYHTLSNLTTIKLANLKYYLTGIVTQTLITTKIQTITPALTITQTLAITRRLAITLTVAQTLTIKLTLPQILIHTITHSLTQTHICTVIYLVSNELTFLYQIDLRDVWLARKMGISRTPVAFHKPIRFSSV